MLSAPLVASQTACSLVPTPRQAQIYRLSPQVNDPPARPIPNAELAIDLPTASESLDTNRIALTQGRTRFDYYADSVWTDRLPLLLQTRMIEAFEADGGVTDVSRDADGFVRGYLLRTDIRQFEARYPSQAAGPPEIAVTLELHLSTGAEGRLVDSTLISAQANSAQNKLDSIVTAFDAAAGHALSESVTWTIRAISMDRMHGRHPRS
jgi:cholesterol transport system auxiliary component